MLMHLLYIILFHWVIAIPQINLYYTDSVSENNRIFQHNCLRLASDTGYPHQNYQIILYCLSELPSQFNITPSNLSPKFNFAELARLNVTSQDLYRWSAPIDLIERYQFYLNEISTSSSSETDVFYNCTMPRFGPMCQYQLSTHSSYHTSLKEIISDSYRSHSITPTKFSCYDHLKCKHDFYNLTCLDWSEICDRKIDCLDSGLDEEHCWELEINECKDNEYRCLNGQCIPQSFFRDWDFNLDCLDGSDRFILHESQIGYNCPSEKPIFVCDDIGCESNYNSNFCFNYRGIRYWERMYSTKDYFVSEKCWSSLKCIFKIVQTDISICHQYCANNRCIENIQNDCPDMLYFPNVPIFFGDVYLAFMKNNTPYVNNMNYQLPYICYNNSRYDPLFNITAKIIFNNTECFHAGNLNFSHRSLNLWSAVDLGGLTELYYELQRFHLAFNYTPMICNRSNMYQCINSSKCISIHRINDNRYDCPYMDDENKIGINDTNLIELLKQTHYQCKGISNKYIHRSMVDNRICDCEYINTKWCEDEDVGSFNFQVNISFQHICDGFVELLPVVINGRNETDETECQQWDCNNVYTHCNTEWNCHNGADEIDCDPRPPPPINCSQNQRICVSPHTNQFTCLPIEQMNDGNVDCLGGTDEPKPCLFELSDSGKESNFYCMKQTSHTCIIRSVLCDGYPDCENGDDEQFCSKEIISTRYMGPCTLNPSKYLSKVENFLCGIRPDLRKMKPSMDFSLLLNTFPKDIETTKFSSSSVLQMVDEYDSICYRGVDLRVYLNDSNQSIRRTCLCPPNYYGDRCQYQNQRISLTIKFRAFSDSWRTQFAVVVALIDDSDQRIIHSYEQLLFLWVKNCQTKFNIYLLYSTRPKDPTKQYAIHIDFYDKVKLTYRGSVWLPVKFTFLPVHRLAFVVDVPRVDEKNQNCANKLCGVHGMCIRYSNNPENDTFCRCDRGWSGRYCTFQYTCLCASESLCIGISANNRSICVCPIDKFGPRCLLTDTVCQNEKNSTCKNGGQCIPNDGYLALNQTFVCICPNGFSGDKCEIADNKLILSFNKEIVLSQSIFIHFLNVHSNVKLLRSTTFRAIPVKQDSVMIYWREPFHMVFIELSNNHYYLAILQRTYEQLESIEKTIHPSDHCPNISELFNQTFLQWHPLRQIKYYHIPCQNQSLNLSCFHDNAHLCLCYTFGEKRLANCFHFDHRMAFDCFGRTECENDGKCFQDSPDCPQRSICTCQPCFYGQRCQFRTSGLGLSLDAIIGYHILPNVSFTHQISIIKFSFALTIIFIIAGLINGTLCLITFKNKPVREVGCGLYLFSSALTTLVTIIIFGFKFFILLLTQMTIISNRPLLEIQCRSLDFILRVCLCLDQWLIACVAIERAMTVIKAVRFNKGESKRAAKFVIFILLLIIVANCIHDPIYRRLIEEGNNGVYDDDDDDQKRIWCIVTYPYRLQLYNSFMHTFHFCGPFLINFISAMILIMNKSRQQSNIHKQRPYKQILREQFRQHKHLLTAPVVLVILALPRLIIAFTSECMKSNDDAWIFIIGYFISFLPPMLTFVIFIVPSDFYKQEFQHSVVQIRTTIQRRLHLI